MLTFDSGIFDPDRRPAAIAAAFAAIGADPEDETIAAAIDVVSEGLDEIFGEQDPQTTSEFVGMLGTYVSVIIAAVNMTRINLEANLGQPAIANIATADAADLPTAIALANANKAKTNAILAALRLAGILET